MSPNDEVTAFVLEEAHQGKRMTSLALYRTKDMLGLSSSRYIIQTYALIVQRLMYECPGTVVKKDLLAKTIPAGQFPLILTDLGKIYHGPA